jgi:hypothetical protein
VPDDGRHLGGSEARVHRDDDRAEPAASRRSRPRRGSSRDGDPVAATDAERASARASD